MARKPVRMLRSGGWVTLNEALHSCSGEIHAGLSSAVNLPTSHTDGVLVWKYKQTFLNPSFLPRNNPLYEWSVRRIIININISRVIYEKSKRF